MKADRPVDSLVWYRGAPYLLDHVVCRRALVERQVEGKLTNINSLARAVNVSRSTASRFFSGATTSLAVTLRTLAVLGLAFRDAARPVSVAYVDGYLVVLDPKDEGYDVTVPVLTGCRTRGANLTEATQRAADAIAAHVSRLRSRGLPVPNEVVLRVVE
jgi:predicted RNase H-like HicB family nuclease